MKLYYYKTARGNFGDDLNGWLWEELLPGLWQDQSTVRVSVIGTIIGENMPPASRWIVMSSGTGYAPLAEDLDRSNWTVICVRGPLTARALGLPPSAAVTDGAILVSLLPAYQPLPPQERQGIVFMPHHAQTLKLGRWREVCARAGVTFLDPRMDSKYLLEHIRRARLVLANAMHAAIAADAVRVPWIPLEISSETSHFKWLDWSLAMDVPYEPIVLPASSLLESWHSKIIAALDLHHTFSDLTAEGAMRHARRLRERENGIADFKRNMVGRTFRILRSVAQAPIVKQFYAWCDRGRVERATAALLSAAATTPVLSQPAVFARKQEEMKKRLEMLKAQADAPEAPATPDPAPGQAPKKENMFGIMRRHFMGDNAVNALLRLGSLAAKLGLTLYMGRYLGLGEMGTYGLITAYVAILVTLLGVRFDYVVSRDIVDAPALEIACKIRDQTIFYGLNYLLLAGLFVLACAGSLVHVDIRIVAYTLILSVLESYAAITSGNFVSLKRPVLANILFFIRAALWVFPVVGLGLMSPAFRTAGTLLFWWIAGVGASLAVTFVAARHLPWLKTLRVPVDWQWIGGGVKKCFPIWLGVIGATAATYVDRFVVEHYLGLDFVGIASFYGSFVLAIQSLLQSGIFAFSFPRLISYHKQGQDQKFRQEVIQTTAQAVIFTGIISLLIGVAVPLMGGFFHRPEFTAHAPALWLMLLGMWIRSTTEGLYYVLYARHQDRIIWAGGLLMLIPAFGCNMLFVPMFGFNGIGYSAIVVSVLLCVWRLYCVLSFRPAPTHDMPVKQAGVSADYTPSA